MSDNRGFVSCLVLGLAGLCSAQVPRSLPKIDLGTPIYKSDSPVSHRCDTSELNILNLTATKALLAAYDLDRPMPWTCMAVRVAWSPAAQILRLSAALGLDDYYEIALLRASPRARVWLIPIERGMIGYPHTEDNPHHLAAFNDLLRLAKYRPDAAGLSGLSDLYQFVVGMPVTTDREPKTLGESVTVNDAEWDVEQSGSRYEFTHKERFGDSWKREYMVWEFTYLKTPRSYRLTAVTRQTLDKFQEENESR